MNTVSLQWETFIQIILGRANLPDWEELWAALRQEEIRRLTRAGSSNKGGWIKKEEEEDAALASIEQQGKRKKKDISKTGSAKAEKEVETPLMTIVPWVLIHL